MSLYSRWSSLLGFQPTSPEEAKLLKWGTVAMAFTALGFILFLGGLFLSTTVFLCGFLLVLVANTALLVICVKGSNLRQAALAAKAKPVAEEAWHRLQELKELEEKRNK